MTNYEHFREQIEKITRLGRRVAVNKDKKPQTCCMMDCNDCIAFGKKESCYETINEWADAEYIEPEVDWSKVTVDTPILVRDSEEDDWFRRHFAKYVDGRIYAFSSGCTSWSSEGTPISWVYAKLAEVE